MATVHADAGAHLERPVDVVQLPKPGKLRHLEARLTRRELAAKVGVRPDVPGRGELLRVDAPCVLGQLDEQAREVGKHGVLRLARWAGQPERR